MLYKVDKPVDKVYITFTIPLEYYTITIV